MIFGIKNFPKKNRPKRDAFLGILLNPKCVTFWSDSVCTKLYKLIQIFSTKLITIAMTKMIMTPFIGLSIILNEIS